MVKQNLSTRCRDRTARNTSWYGGRNVEAMKSAKVDLKVQIVIAVKVNSTVYITVRMVTIALDSFIWARGAKLRVNDWRARHKGLGMSDIQRRRYEDLNRMSEISTRTGLSARVMTSERSTCNPTVHNSIALSIKLRSTVADRIEETLRKLNCQLWASLGRTL